MPWAVIIPAVASLAGGYMAGQGGRAAANAQTDAANQNAALQREIYRDQRGLAMPGYLTGGAATNKLAALFGIAPQDYARAFQGGNNYGYGTYNPNDWGAGQPVQGHTGGGGNSLLGAGVGYVLGGPLGGLAGGMIRNGGDNWQTLGTSAPTGFDYNAYWNSNPDLQTDANGWNKPDVQSLFGGNRDAYLWWHYNNFGRNEGRTLPTVGGGTGTGTGTGTDTGGGTGTGGTATATNPLQEFYDSPYMKLATTLNNQQFDQIKGQMGAAGKSISGAAEGRYAKTLAGNTYGAFGDYTNALRSLAGLQQTSTSQIGNAASQYGSQAGNAITQAGTARANALSSAYRGWGQGISGALGSVDDYGKSQGWWD